MIYLFIYWLDTDSYMTLLSVAIIFFNINSIPILNEINFKDSKREHSNSSWLHGSGPYTKNWLTSTTKECSTGVKKEFERWDHLDRMSLMIIKGKILEIFRSRVLKEVTTPKESLYDIEKLFLENNKVEWVKKAKGMENE